MDSKDPPSGTRADLLQAGLHLFGRDGYAATSTRAIAAKAGTNVASIAYHFGGKEALRVACGEEVLRRIAAVAGQPQEPTPLSADEAFARLEATLRGLVSFLTRSPQASDTAAFMLRELAEGGPALSIVYESFIRPKHQELCRLAAVAGGPEPDSEETKLLVFSMLGQALYFRLGEPIVRRQMGWNAYGDAEAQAIADRLVANLRAALGRDR